VSTTLPSQVEICQLADGVHFRLPPPVGAYPGDRHEVWVTTDGKLRWQTGSRPSRDADEVAVEDLVQFVVGPFGDLAVLSVETRQDGLRALCTGYPLDWLKALADVLSCHCNVPTRTDSDLESRPSAPPLASASPAEQRASWVHQLGEGVRSVYEKLQAASARVPEFQENPDQPPNSRVIHEVHDDGVTLIVPPPGPNPFFLLGCALCALAALFTLAVINTGFPGGIFSSLVGLMVFWAIALAVFLPTYHMAYAHTAIAVVGDDLELCWSSKLRTLRRSWNRADLTDVRCGDTGWVSGSDDSNLTPIKVLHILLKGENKFGLLAGRDDAELRWIATVLRRALRLPHSP
jgi:hypothetical protein